MTRQDIESAVREWKHRLNLNHWLVRIDWDRVPENIDAGAKIVFTDKSDRATIIFEHNILSESEETINRWIAHELMHIHLHGVYDTIYDMVDKDSPDGRMLLNYLHGELERVNDRIATAYASFAGNPLN